MALYAVLGAVLAAVAAALLISYALGAAILLVGVAVGLFLAGKGSGPKVELFYNLDAGAEARFSGVRNACEALAGSEKVWRVDGEAVDGAPVGPRAPVSVGLLETSGFSANVEIWGISVGEAGLFFLP